MFARVNATLKTLILVKRSRNWVQLVKETNPSLVAFFLCFAFWRWRLRCRWKRKDEEKKTTKTEKKFFFKRKERKKRDE